MCTIITDKPIIKIENVPCMLHVESATDGRGVTFYTFMYLTTIL